jgi:hypothetical protein
MSKSSNKLSKRHQLRDEARGFQIIANAVVGSDQVVLTVGSSEGWLSVIRVKYLWSFEHLLSLGKLLRLGIFYPIPEVEALINNPYDIDEYARAYAEETARLQGGPQVEYSYGDRPSLTTSIHRALDDIARGK